MNIDCISDLHGYFPSLPGGDILIVAGDCTASNKLGQWDWFFNWFERQKYKKKILVGGNHDGFLASAFPKTKEEANDIKDIQSYLLSEGQIKLPDFEYLCDSGIEYEGLKFWGSPWTPLFCNWYFMKPRAALKDNWDMIPDDTDILITHGPAYGFLDHCESYFRSDEFQHAGCEELEKAIYRVKPKLHIFGHIHEDGGKTYTLEHNDGKVTHFLNVAYLDRDYKPMGLMTRAIIQGEKVELRTVEIPKD